MKKTLGIGVGLLLIFIYSTLHANETKEPAPEVKNQDIKELAMQVQNPVSDLERFGFTHIVAFGTGPTNSDINNLNLIANTTRQFGQWSILNRLNIPLFYLPSSVRLQEIQERVLGWVTLNIRPFLPGMNLNEFLDLSGGLAQPSFSKPPLMTEWGLANGA
jgi:hypothetical protein